MDNDRMMARQVGRRLRELREERGLSQDELSARAGLSSQGALSNIEQGKRLPSLPTVIAVTKVLGVPVVELIGAQSPDNSARQRAHHLVDHMPETRIDLVVRLLEAVAADK